MSHQYIPPKLAIGLNSDGSMPTMIAFPTKSGNPMQVGNQLQIPAYGNPTGKKETDRFQVFTSAGEAGPKFVPQGNGYHYNGQQWVYGSPQYSYAGGVGDAVPTINIDEMKAAIKAKRKAAREAKVNAAAAAAVPPPPPPAAVPVPAPAHDPYLGRAPAPGYQWGDYNIPINAHPGHAAQRGWQAPPFTLGPLWQPTTFTYWAREGETLAQPAKSAAEQAWLDQIAVIHSQNHAAQHPPPPAWM